MIEVETLNVTAKSCASSLLKINVYIISQDLYEVDPVQISARYGARYRLQPSEYPSNVEWVLTIAFPGINTGAATTPQRLWQLLKTIFLCVLWPFYAVFQRGNVEHPKENRPSPACPPTHAYRMTIARRVNCSVLISSLIAIATSAKALFCAISCHLGQIQAIPLLVEKDEPC